MNEPFYELQVELKEIASGIVQRWMLQQDNINKIIQDRLELALTNENIVAKIDKAINNIFDSALSIATEDAINKLKGPLSDMFENVIEEYEKKIREKMK